MHKSLIYLATPYSHPDPAVQHERFLAVNKVAAGLMAAGLYVFSPISHTHPIAEAGELPRHWEYWREYDRAILSGCGCLAVLMLEGWSKSTGVTGEIEIADELDLPIVYIPYPPITESYVYAIDIARSGLERRSGIKY